MKIPKTFIPEKEYSKKKIYEITKKHYNKSEDIDENITLEGKIIIQAKEVAEKLGKLTGNTYVFTDKKNNFIISYEPYVALQDIQLLTIQKKGIWRGITKREYFFKSVKWNESSKEEIRIYVPGDWQVHLEKLYKTAQQR